jgi:hypothetical protein
MDQRWEQRERKREIRQVTNFLGKWGEGAGPRSGHLIILPCCIGQYIASTYLYTSRSCIRQVPFGPDPGTSSPGSISKEMMSPFSRVVSYTMFFTNDQSTTSPTLAKALHSVDGREV